MAKPHLIAKLGMVALVTLTVNMFLASPLANSLPGCWLVDSWIAAHSQSLPTSYDGLMAFPPRYRTRIFNVIDTSTRAEIWRTHLARSIESNQSLTHEERTFIEGLIQTIRPAFYSRPKSPEVVAEMQGLHAEAERIFMNSPNLTIIKTLDDNGRFVRKIAGWRFDALLVRVSEAVTSFGAVNAAGAREQSSCGTCFCSPEYSYQWSCGGGTTCTSPSGPYYCESTSYGCGFIGWYACTALCCTWDGTCYGCV